MNGDVESLLQVIEDGRLKSVRFHWRGVVCFEVATRDWKSARDTPPP